MKSAAADGILGDAREDESQPRRGDGTEPQPSALHARMQLLHRGESPWMASAPAASKKGYGLIARTPLEDPISASVYVVPTGISRA
jgi:hypothetical protein